MAKRRASGATPVDQASSLPAADAPRAFHPPIRLIHGKKIVALAANRKVPDADRPRVMAAKERYETWVQTMDDLTLEGDALLMRLVELLNEYKRFIEIELIYDSPGDFLRRHSGQHKVDNSILEEFLPRLADTRLVPGLGLLPGYKAGPQSSFAAFTIIGSVHTPLDSSVFIRKKNQDYAISKQIYLKASSTPAFAATTTYQTELTVAYLAAECKTNLDKTMFNEGLEASRALKQAVSSARYLLICEWLDMPPIDTKLTDINEAIILRKAKRLGSDFRDALDTVAGRREAREEFVGYYDAHPLHIDSFRRIVTHLNLVFPPTIELDEHSVLERGYF